MWVQLLSVKHLDTDGRTRQHFPGDWVDVGRQSALRWIAEGSARAARPLDLELPAGCGVVLLEESPIARTILSRVDGLAVTVGEPSLEYERTLLWDPSAPLRLDLLGVGFALLDRWDVAAPLASYSQLAADIGSEEERGRTEAVIHDLRVPYYDMRLIFLRRCYEAEATLGLWKQAVEAGCESRHSFLRALYVSQPRVCALPTTWTEGK